jgi:hypothetical protein
MDRTIKLVEVFEFNARGMLQQVDIASLSDEVLAHATLHGLKQTIADAASNAAGSAYDGARAESAPHWKDMPAAAKRSWATSNAGLVEQEAEALMHKRIAALVEGDWTTRASAAPGMSKFEEYAAEFVAAKMEFPKGTRKPEKLQLALEKFRAQPQKTQDAIGKLVKERIEREREADALAIDLDL